MNATVRQWLEKAEGDLDGADQASRFVARPHPELVLYLCQQGVEKLLKAALVARRITPPFTHDLERLSGMLTAAEPGWDADAEELRWLSRGATVYRYPGGAPDPTPEDAGRGLGSARDLRRRLLPLIDPPAPPYAPGMSQASNPPDHLQETGDLPPEADPVPGGQVQAPATANADGAKMADPPRDLGDDSARPAGKAEIKFDDFEKLDLRVATVTSCEPHPNADKLLVLQLDDGTPDGRQICAGLRGVYEPGDLVGKQIVVVANLAPRKMRGEVSQGMLLAASDEGRSKVVVVGPTAEIAAGASVG